MAIGDFKENSGEFSEIAVGEQEVPERVAGAGIESGGNENQVGFEGVGGGNQLLAKSAFYFAPARAGRKRTVESRALSLALSGFGGGAGARLPGILMGAEEEH